jgi:hypothetical protein
MNQRAQELHLDVLALRPDEQEDRAEGEQPEQERRSLADADRPQAKPDEEREPERPEERRDAAVDARGAQVHVATITTLDRARRGRGLHWDASRRTKKSRRADFVFVHRFR